MLLRPLTLREKTGFINNPNIPVIIRDARGILFYSTETLKKPVTKFNLPPGKYFVDSGSFSPMLRPVQYKLAKLPPRQRNYKKPYGFKIVFGNNPNKCSIVWGLKTIIFDNKLKEKPYPVLFFILFHEFAHAVYTKEKWADKLSGNYMKIYGFNPSQIGKAPIQSLSSAADYRKSLMVDTLIKYS